MKFLRGSLTPAQPPIHSIIYYAQVFLGHIYTVEKKVYLCARSIRAISRARQRVPYHTNFTAARISDASRSTAAAALHTYTFTYRLWCAFWVDRRKLFSEIVCGCVCVVLFVVYTLQHTQTIYVYHIYAFVFALAPMRSCALRARSAIAASFSRSISF